MKERLGLNTLTRGRRSSIAMARQGLRPPISRLAQSTRSRLAGAREPQAGAAWRRQLTFGPRPKLTRPCLGRREVRKSPVRLRARAGDMGLSIEPAGLPAVGGSNRPAQAAARPALPPSADEEHGAHPARETSSNPIGAQNPSVEDAAATPFFLPAQKFVRPQPQFRPQVIEPESTSPIAAALLPPETL